MCATVFIFAEEYFIMGALVAQSVLAGLGMVLC